MAPNAQSCRGSFFVILPLFTQDLRRLSTEETKSTSILTGSPSDCGQGNFTRASGGEGGRFCNLEKATDCSLTECSPHNLVGAGSCKQETHEAELPFQKRNENPAKAVQMCVQRQITCTLKYASTWYNGKWWVKKNSDCSLDENHFTHWLEK